MDTGTRVGATNDVGEGVDDEVGVKLGSSLDGSGVEAVVAVAVAVAVGVGEPDGTGAVKVSVGAGTVLVAVGSIAATRTCSCIPSATAKNRVRAISVAAISPLQSGPKPLPTPPDLLSLCLPAPDPKAILPLVNHHQPCHTGILLPKVNSPT